MVWKSLLTLYTHLSTDGFCRTGTKLYVQITRSQGIINQQVGWIMKILLLASMLFLANENNKPESTTDMCELFGEFAIYWVNKRDEGMSKNAMKIDAFEMNVPLDEGGHKKVNKMFYDLVNYIYSYPYPSAMDAEIDAREMCFDVVRNM